ncbi:MAG TPA: ATP-binding protein [Patescibacteria group bacterium]|nr:ATP-binding protein [Patescibacteria group bacterium]
MGLVIASKEGATIEDVAEGNYKLSYTPGFTALGAQPRAKDESDPRIVAVCDLAQALFTEIFRVERLHNYGGCRPDVLDFGLPDVLPVLVVNAVMHGNRFDSGKHVEIEYAFDELRDARGRFTLTVRDEGRGFDYRSLLRAEEDARGSGKSFNVYRRPEERPADSIGLGLFQLMGYLRSDRGRIHTQINWTDPGNEVRVVKYLRPIEARRMTPRPYT